MNEGDFEIYGGRIVRGRRDSELYIGFLGFTRLRIFDAEHYMSCRENALNECAGR
jgi:hypothetical protein